MQQRNVWGMQNVAAFLGESHHFNIKSGFFFSFFIYWVQTDAVIFVFPLVLIRICSKSVRYVNLLTPKNKRLNKPRVNRGKMTLSVASLPADVRWGSFVTHSFLPHGVEMGDVGEKWMRDKRTPTDVWGEASAWQDLGLDKGTAFAFQATRPSRGSDNYEDLWKSWPLSSRRQ